VSDQDEEDTPGGYSPNPSMRFRKVTRMDPIFGARVLPSQQT
jgi:hypothetical protein